MITLSGPSRLWGAAITIVFVLALLGGVLAHVDQFAVIAVVENALLATLAILTAAEAGLLGANQRTTRLLLLGCSGLLFAATALWEVDRLSGGRIQVSYGDWAAILGWLGAACALRHGLRHGLIEGARGRLFGAVFIVHSLSVAVDLVDHVLLGSGLSTRFVGGLCEVLELAFMGGYAFCIAGLAWKAWTQRSMTPAVAKTSDRDMFGFAPAADGDAQPVHGIAPASGEGVVSAGTGLPEPADAASVGVGAGQSRKTLPSAFLDGGDAGAAAEHRSRGRFEALCAFGIERHHRVVDYGCGNLRVGEHFMRYLEPRRYVGLDLNEAILRSGFNRLAVSLLQQKRPFLAVVRPQHLQKVRALGADWIVCTSVVTHVPPQRVGQFLDQVCWLAGPDTRLLITFDDAEESEQIGPMAWAYPERVLVGQIRRRLTGRPIATRILEDIDPFDGRAWHRSLIFVGPARRGG